MRQHRNTSVTLVTKEVKFSGLASERKDKFTSRHRRQTLHKKDNAGPVNRG